MNNQDQLNLEEDIDVLNLDEEDINELVDDIFNNLQKYEL